MKKSANLFFKLLVLLGLVLAPMAQAYLLDTGGGRYYNTETGMYQNADGSITSSTSDGFAVLTTPVTTTTNTSPLGTTPSNNCIAGTQIVLADGSGQCQAYINSQITTISFCTGQETSGPCRPTRIDATSAALEAARQSQLTGQNCTAELVGFPGVDPNTGLSYYYNITCTPRTGSTTGTGITGTTGGTFGGTQTTGTVSSQQAYITSLMSIIQSLVNVSKSIQGTISLQNTGGSPLPPLYTPSGTLVGGGTQVIPGGTTGGTTGGSTNCYYFANILQVGSTGNDVLALTTQLKKEGFLTNVTSTFDTNVMTAVKRLQEAHSLEILSPLGLTQGTGVVGAKTLAYLNSACVVVATTSTGTTSSCDVIGATNSNTGLSGYRYTFTRVSSTNWNVALNNPAYSIASDPYYVQPNFSFTAPNALDLNRQNQGRFNYLSTLPGTPEGNTEYAKLFGSFNNAYYDWDNMTKGLTSRCTTN